MNPQEDSETISSASNQFDIRDDKTLPSVANRISGIDSARATAALLVFACHSYPYMLGRTHPLPSPVPQLLANGAHGVDLFIVISGFCLALPSLVGKQPRAIEFWRRRAFRILPPYYVALAVCAILALNPATSHRVVASTADWLDLTRYVLLVQTLFGGPGAINGSYWSIALEAHLYLLFPATLVLFYRLCARTFILSAGAMSIIWLSLTDLAMGSLGSEFLLPARYIEFVAGMVLARLLHEGRIPSRLTTFAVLIVGGVLGLVVSTLDLDVLSAVVWVVPSVALIVVFTHYAPSFARLEWLGRVSYSFYLAHQPVLLLASPMAVWMYKVTQYTFPLAVLICFAITLVLAWLLYIGVERPSMAASKRKPVALRPAIIRRLSRVRPR